VEDVVYFLSSRHGIQAHPDLVEQDILTNLAGDFGSNSSQVMDLCQMASILLLPHVKKLAAAMDESKHNKDSLLAKRDDADGGPALFAKGFDLIMAELSPHDPRWYNTTTTTNTNHRPSSSSTRLIRGPVARIITTSWRVSSVGTIVRRNGASGRRRRHPMDGRYLDPGHDS
jgi:hypothetical protein